MIRLTGKKLMRRGIEKQTGSQSSLVVWRIFPRGILIGWDRREKEDNESHQLPSSCKMSGRGRLNHGFCILNSSYIREVGNDVNAASGSRE